MGDDFGPLGPTWFEVAFGVVALLILVGFVLTIALAVRNVRAVRRAGRDPWTLQAEIATQLASSSALAPSRSLEERLAELDDLLARGVISASENAAARAAVLAG